MKEKTIFKTTAKTPLKAIFITVAVVAVLAMFIVALAVNGDMGTAFRYFGYGYYWFLIGAAIFVGLAFWLGKRRNTLTVTDLRVRVESSSGKKKAEIPAAQISAAACGLFKRVTVASSGGHISLFFVEDKEGAYKSLTELMIEKQFGTSAEAE